MKNLIRISQLFVFCCIVILFVKCSRDDDPIPEPDPIKPECCLKTLKNQTVFERGEQVELIADVSDADGDIQRVEFKLDSELIVEDTEAPFSYVWDTKNVDLGYHTLSVVAVDNDNLQTSSSLQIEIIAKPREWTILNYFAGNNNLEDYLINDLQEMETAGSSDEVTSLVMLNSRKAGGTAKYYEIEKHTDHLSNQILSPVVNDNLGTQDMSDPRTLRDFIEWGIQNYPAQRYMLIINSHGGGWAGICPEESTDELMRMDEFREALGDVHFDAIVFHSCLMGMVEVAYEISENADYMVASPGNMPAVSVLAADVWLKSVIDEPQQSTKSIMDFLAKSVYNRSQESGLLTPISVTDLSKVMALVSDISEFRKNMLNLNHNCWDEVKEAWEAAEVKDLDAYELLFRDLGLFVTQLLRSDNQIVEFPLIKNSLEEIERTLGEAVYRRYNAGDYVGDGLTIHFPHDSGYLGESRYELLKFQPATEWMSFIKAFIASSPEESEEKAYFSGTVTWPGHTLSAHWNVAVCYYDSNDKFQSDFIEIGSANGAYSLVTSNGNWPRQYYIAAWDDVNSNNSIDAGDGFGFWDKNNSGTWDDVLTINIGDDIKGVDMVMSTEKSGEIKSASLDYIKDKLLHAEITYNSLENSIYRE